MNAVPGIPSLLHIEASPMAARSTSTAIAQAFIAAYRERHPDASIDHIDVWNMPLPAFDTEMIGAKFAALRAQNATPEQAARWAEAVAIARRFNEANVYLISTPMWNFGIPYQLKHFIDVVTLPGENWTWSRETGYRGLLHGKRALLIGSSAGEYPALPEYDAADFQKPYLRRWLHFIGVDDVQEISAGPTLAPAEQVAAMKSSAIEAARKAAASF